MTNEIFGWGLIGCGGAGRAHAKYATIEPDVTVRAFCDVDAGTAERLAAEHDGAVHTTDPARLLEDPEIDILAIATAHDSHADLAVAAFEAGKHLFLEKPMAMSVADCLRIEAARKASGCRLQLNFSIRFSGAARAIRQRLGTPLVSHGQCTQSPADLTTWRWHPTIGGGPLYDVGVHALDLLCWVHDADPVEVFATGGQVSHAGQLGSPDMVDTCAATLRFANDSVATFLMADAGRNEILSKWFFEFFDGAGTAVLHEHFKTATFTRPNAASGELVTETVKPPEAPRLCDLVSAIRTGTDPAIGAREGIRSAVLVQCIEASIRTGEAQAVKMPAF